MKHLYLKRKFYAAAIAFAATALISGCSKQTPTPQKTNDNGSGDSGTINGNPPLLFGYTPTNGVVGTVITLMGTNFDPLAANDKVYLNNDLLSVVSASPTAVVAYIGTTLDSGPVSMKVGSTLLSTPIPFTVTFGSLTNVIHTRNFQPQNIIVDGNKNVISFNDNSVFKINTDGSVSNIGIATDMLKGIADVTLVAAGDFYIANAGKYNIMKLTQGGLLTTFAGDGTNGYAEGTGTAAKFSAIKGICHDNAGNLYVIDARRIRKITTTGVVSTLAGSDTDGNADGTGAAAQFGDPAGIAIDKTDGTLYVTDSKYLNVRKITPGGVVTTLAGNGRHGFTDGNSATAQFTTPTRLAVDASGNIWVIDGSPTAAIYKIREMNKIGVVTTYFQGNTATGDPVTGYPNVATIVNPVGLAFDDVGALYIANSGPGVISKMVLQ